MGKSQDNFLATGFLRLSPVLHLSELDTIKERLNSIAKKRLVVI